MMKLTMQILRSHQVMLHTLFGNILLLQTIPMLRKAGPRMLSVRFVTKAQVDAARLEQWRISYCILPWAKLK